MPFSEGVQTIPLEWRFWCPANEGRKPPLSQDDILDRLDDAQALLRLSPDAYAVLVEIVCPDEGLDAGEPARPLGTPTDTLPGTEDRVAVLAHRLKMGFELFHPHDATWDDPEEEHSEQMGEMLRNGAIKRTRCKVAHRDGASIVIPHDPEEAVDTLRRAFTFAELRELAGLLWEGVGYRPRKPQPPGEGFVVLAEQLKPTRRRGRRKRRGEQPGQLLLWTEQEQQTSPAETPSETPSETAA